MENTQTPQSDIPILPPQDFQSPALPQTHQNTKLPLIIGGLFLVCVIGGAGYYLGTKNAKQTTLSPKEMVVHASPEPVSSSPTPEGDFRKRSFDPASKWYADKLYPQELLSIGDEKLIGIKCSPQYTVGGDGGGKYYEGESNQELSDPNILQKVQSLVQSGKTVDAFMYCQTNSNLALFEYEEQKGGGGSETIAYFGSMTGNTFDQWASLPNPGLAYFTCRQPLQFTTNTQLYVSCTGGDGGGGGAGIYRIDGVSQDINQVAFCTTAEDKVTCK